MSFGKLNYLLYRVAVFIRLNNLWSDIYQEDFWIGEDEIENQGMMNSFL